MWGCAIFRSQKGLQRPHRKPRTDKRKSAKVSGPKTITKEEKRVREHNRRVQIAAYIQELRGLLFDCPANADHVTVLKQTVEQMRQLLGENDEHHAIKREERTSEGFSARSESSQPVHPVAPVIAPSSDPDYEMQLEHVPSGSYETMTKSQKCKRTRAPKRNSNSEVPERSVVASNTRDVSQEDIELFRASSLSRKRENESKPLYSLTAPISTPSSAAASSGIALSSLYSNTSSGPGGVSIFSALVPRSVVNLSGGAVASPMLWSSAWSTSGALNGTPIDVESEVNDVLEDMSNAHISNAHSELDEAELHKGDALEQAEDPSLAADANEDETKERELTTPTPELGKRRRIATSNEIFSPVFFNAQYGYSPTNMFSSEWLDLEPKVSVS